MVIDHSPSVILRYAPKDVRHVERRETSPDVLHSANPGDPSLCSG
ncbi:hypothetical protein BN59_01808 [Legionella massiliensis]|uniref:Uncharacterized protein n=1 Tax=Legionella massiliensis TaxID=1034943 RepID=A0A078KSX1_9GAMM|nr:hypothetical protein BN59_01808 [Legionella massiliensis]CEE13263.1 hypothetical protein BN1094_01808 [Legionella massiliensis]